MANLRPITTSGDLSEFSSSDSLLFGASIVLVEQGSSPSTPASGLALLYVKTDGNLYFKNDAGTETQLN
jgi:hypothetical protein